MGAVVVAAAATLAAGCSSDSDEQAYDELCIDNQTSERVPDEWCEDDSHHGTHSFVYIPYTSGVAQPKYPIGSRVSHPAMTPVKPAAGSFVRGGFGGVRGGTSGV